MNKVVKTEFLSSNITVQTCHMHFVLLMFTLTYLTSHYADKYAKHY